MLVGLTREFAHSGTVGTTGAPALAACPTTLKAGSSRNLGPWSFHRGLERFLNSKLDEPLPKVVASYTWHRLTAVSSVER